MPNQQNPAPGESTSFRDRVIAEALKQKELRAAGQRIPPEFKWYSRISGLVTFLVCTLGTALVLKIGLGSGSYYVFAILFFAALALGGLIQAVTGQHLLTRR